MSTPVTSTSPHLSAPVKRHTALWVWAICLFSLSLWGAANTAVMWLATLQSADAGLVLAVVSFAMIPVAAVLVVAALVVASLSVRRRARGPARLALFSLAGHVPFVVALAQSGIVGMMLQ